MPSDDLRRTPPVRAARRRTALGWVAVALVAGLGLAAVALGVAQRTVWLPDDRVSATAALPPVDGGTAAVLAVTAPGVLETRPGPVTVTATAADGRPVVLALGHETDVMAWTDDVPTAVLGGLTGGQAPAGGQTLAVRAPGAAASTVEVPDVGGSDLWVQVAEGAGSATFEVEPPEGRLLLLVASDGTAAAPEEITLTWAQEVATPAAVPLLAGGAVALLLALVLGVVHARTSRRRHDRALVAAGTTASHGTGDAGGAEEHRPEEDDR